MESFYFIYIYIYILKLKTKDGEERKKGSHTHIKVFFLSEISLGVESELGNGFMCVASAISCG